MQYRLGLVLSGGGSRGLAHAGVLQALAEAGLAPDCLSGSSSGALVGALYAAGYDAPAVLEFFATTSPFRLSRLAALRRPGWLDTEKIVADIAAYFPEDSFEALGKKLFVTATELESGKLEVFSSGPLVARLVASASVPMVFTPTRLDGRLYADGGILDNFPVEPLLGLCDIIVGVYASPLGAVEHGALATSFAVAQRALELGMYTASARKFHRAALVIAPPELRRFATFDLKRHREILELGYHSARERLDEIRGLLDRSC